MKNQIFFMLTFSDDIETLSMAVAMSVHSVLDEASDFHVAEAKRRLCKTILGFHRKHGGNVFDVRDLMDEFYAGTNDQLQLLFQETPTRYRGAYQCSIDELCFYNCGDDFCHHHFVLHRDQTLVWISTEDLDNSSHPVEDDYTHAEDLENWEDEEIDREARKEDELREDYGFAT